MHYPEPTPDFARLKVCSGLIETICLHCLSVIATGSSETALAIAERAHICPQAHLPALSDSRQAA